MQQLDLLNSGRLETQQRKSMLLPKRERQERSTAAVNLAGPTADPHKHLRHDLAEEMRKLSRKHKCNFIVMGDFNINLNKRSPELERIMTWGQEEGLTNLYLDKLGPTPKDQLNYMKDKKMPRNSGTRGRRAYQNQTLTSQPPL